MVNQRVVRYVVPRGSYCDMEALRNAPKRTEIGEREKYNAALNMLENKKTGDADRFMAEAGISRLYGDVVSDLPYY